MVIWAYAGLVTNVKYVLLGFLSAGNGYSLALVVKASIPFTLSQTFFSVLLSQKKIPTQEHIFARINVHGI